MVKGQDFQRFLDNESPGFYLIAAESEVYRVHGPIFTELFITNYVDFKTENPQNYLIHFVAFDRNTYALSHNPSCSSSKSVIIYDYFNRPFVSLEQTYEEFMQNYNPNVKNIFVVDKLNIFNCYCNHSFQSIVKFYKALRQKTFKIFGIINASISSSNELNETYNNADMIAFIMDNEDYRSKETFTCYILKNRPDSKSTMNKICFQFVDGSVQQIEADKITNISRTDDQLAALTTFKLTLNEHERDSKNKLHLPYFDAQRKDLDMTSEEMDDDDFEDEEDEEI